MATLQDRFNINSQLEHLQTKYVGTGVPPRMVLSYTYKRKLVVLVNNY